jgi:ABC-type proline/glycine betaine transport system substrate-binding protein
MATSEMHSSMAGLIHTPIILIPGMTAEASAMEPVKRDLVISGWSPDILFIWTDSSKMTQDLAVAAQELGEKVNEVIRQTGAAKLVLITWSASALAGRYYIKELGGSKKVSIYIAFAAPQHGTTNNACRQFVSCQQFGDFQSPFLTALNAGTEVPGSPAVKYLTISSMNDVNVLPAESTILSGADENYLMSGRTAPNHFTIISDQAALAKMKGFIRANE